MKASTAAKTKRTAATAAAPEEKRKFRIVLVEDHPIVRQGLAQLINLQPGLSVIGEAESAAKALDLVRANKPDLVILDVSLPKTNGLELIKQLKAEKPNLPMLVISMHDETLYAERALRAGARGYVMKKEPSEKMLLAINRVLKGEIYVSDRMKQKMLQHLVNNQIPEENTSPLDHLSDRELEVFQLLGNGFATRQIAEQLNLSIKTIESYRENLKLKLSVKSGAELIQHAIQWMKSEPAL
jgi:DNA-binding NarL/FixJ family response regulator